MPDKIDKKIQDTVKRMTSGPATPKRKRGQAEPDRHQRLTERRISRLVTKEHERQSRRKRA